MNKKSKVLTIIGILSLIVIAIITSTYIASAQNWQDYMVLESNTEQCFGTCEAIFTITNPTSNAISLASNDVKVWYQVTKGAGLTKHISKFSKQLQL